MHMNCAAIKAQLGAIVRNAGARAAGGELLQHLDELRLARCAQALGGEKRAQRLRRVGIATREVTRRARECLAPAGIALAEERRDPQANEVARECL